MKRNAIIYGVVILMLTLGSFAYAAGNSSAAIDKFKDVTTGMEFVFVKGGCFQMGDVFGDSAKDEKPVHKVCISDFQIGKHEVTQGQWQKVMGENPSGFKQCGANCPVENVSWDQAQEFLQLLNKNSGTKYRLPTEAEWEYAARSGGKQEKYAGDGSLDEVAWYKGNSENTTHPVGLKKPNGLGLFDMNGNVDEWCGDWYGDDYYAQSPQQDPKGPATGTDRVLRGGRWNGASESRHLRTTNRSYDPPAERENSKGFRLVLPSK